MEYTNVSVVPIIIAALKLTKDVALYSCTISENTAKLALPDIGFNTTNPINSAGTCIKFKIGPKKFENIEINPDALKRLTAKKS